MMTVLIAAIVAASAAPPASSGKPIIVIGERIRDAEATLQACLARHCPPDEDIDATLALAEGELIAGKYHDARKTLRHSIGRNKDEARNYPEPVSDLYRANARVAASLGLDRDYYNSTWSIYRSLKEGLADRDYRHFTALMEVAEMMGRVRGHERARLYYSSIRDQALEAGRPDIAALAELRLYLRHWPPGYTRNTRIARIANDRDPKMRPAALEAKLALVRMAFETKDQASAEALIGDFARFDLKRPILIYSPPYELLERELDNNSDFGTSMSAAPAGGGLGGNGTGTAGTGASVTSGLRLAQFSSTKRIAAAFDDMWIDAAFKIADDGKVSDLKVSRSSGDIFWAKPLLASIKGRRYTPGKPGSAATKRLERYTYTSGYERKTEGRMADRSPQGRIEYIDLSPAGISTPD